jgi:hypothetical protein
VHSRISSCLQIYKVSTPGIGRCRQTELDASRFVYILGDRNRFVSPPFPNAHVTICLDTIRMNPIDASYKVPELSYNDVAAKIDIKRPIRMDTLDGLLRCPIRWPILRGTVPKTKLLPIPAIKTIILRPDDKGRAIIGVRNGTFASRNLARACDIFFGAIHEGGMYLEETMYELRHLVPVAMKSAGTAAPCPWPSLTLEVRSEDAVDAVAAFIYSVSMSS